MPERSLQILIFITVIFIMKTNSHIITSNKRAAYTQPRPAFLPSYTTSPFQLGLLHSSLFFFLCPLSRNEVPILMNPRFLSVTKM